MKKPKDISEFDDHFKSLNKKLKLSENEQNDMLLLLNKKIDSTLPKKGFPFKYYLSLTSALIILVIMGSYYITNVTDTSDYSHQANKLEKIRIISIPVLDEIGLSLEQKSSSKWNIKNSSNEIVGNVSVINSSDFENRHKMPAVFENKELDDFQYPTSFIRQHVKKNNIIQTLYFYMNIGEKSTNQFIVIKIHTPIVNEENAFKIAKNIQFK